MVKATLAYNPYVLETTILFNGKSPRINSVVEKYQDMPLQKWVKELPRIFHDEMNGYGFELEFSGTKFDYEKVKAAFLALGIDEDSVHVVLKNELDNRSRKVELIKEMTSWLDQNRNRRFDFEFYCEEEQSLYDGIKSLIVIGEELLDTSVLISMYDISSEQISKIDELDKADRAEARIKELEDRLRKYEENPALL